MGGTTGNGPVRFEKKAFRRGVEDIFRFTYVRRMWRDLMKLFNLN